MASELLITGGAGFIGSHACVVLQEAGYRPVILDNLSNSDAAVLHRLEKITGTRPEFIRGDVRDGTALDAIFSRRDIKAVMHFAGLKAVGESVLHPLAYYDNNVHGSIQLLSAMQRAGVRTFIFSSSATVYGNPQQLPIQEDHPRSATNPYGHSKLMVEDILADLHASEPGWKIARLRYFNPVGAHPSGLIGESPRGTPNNLMPYVAQVAAGQRHCLQVFGDDYDTPDGTGVRDYVHVMDLAEGHLAALRYCEDAQEALLTVNLGTGRGYSVLEMVQTFAQASQRPVPYEVVARRRGDIAACWADPSLARTQLGWTARLGIAEMCNDAWRWQSSL